ncbi:MAG: aminotransferase class I/II-fold pyridoxal phosphate-dependent enzyme [Lachnoclostridium sp.]|nr:aminotransferase class I/II-fold pyridoxal phosphate-dependent enzyme [Lachnoclostridium sp.]
MIEGHGDDIYKFDRRIKLNFSSNVVSTFDHNGLLRHLAGKSWLIGSYPPPSPVNLEEKIANNYGISSENVMVTAGATDAIYSIASLYRQNTSGIVVPSFREYEDACVVHDHKVKYLSSFPSDVQPDILWICSPANPTGIVTPKNEILGYARSNHDTLVIVDQAYAHYTDLPIITPTEAAGMNNLLLLGSFTKRFATPGLRIGYIIGNVAIISRLKERRMPWNIGGISMEAAGYLLDNASDYIIDYKTLNREIGRISKELERVGISATRSDCNFALFCLPEGLKACDLKQWLVDEEGILIRDASNFRGLDERHFRVAARMKDDNNLLINSLRRWISLQQ